MYSYTQCLIVINLYKESGTFGPKASEPTFLAKYNEYLRQNSRNKLAFRITILHSSNIIVIFLHCRKATLWHHESFFSALADQAAPSLLQAFSQLKQATTGRSGVHRHKMRRDCDWPSRCCTSKALRSFRLAPSSNPPLACIGMKVSFSVAGQQKPDPSSLVPVGIVSGLSKIPLQPISPKRSSWRAIVVSVMPSQLTLRWNCASPDGS